MDKARATGLHKNINEINFFRMNKLKNSSDITPTQQLTAAGDDPSGNPTGNGGGPWDPHVLRKLKNFLENNKKKAYLSYLDYQRGARNDYIAMSPRYAHPETGFDAFVEDYYDDYKEQWDHNNDLAARNARGRDKTMFNRACTEARDSSGDIRRCNVGVVSGLLETVKTDEYLTKKEMKKFSIDPERQEFMYKVPKSELSTEGVEPVTFKDMGADESLLVVLNSVKVPLGLACKIMDYPVFRTKELMRKNDWSFEKAGAKAKAKEEGKTVTVSGEDKTVKEYVDAWAYKFKGYTRSEIMARFKAKDYDPEETVKSLRKGNSHFKPVTAWWNENGSIKSKTYESVQVASKHTALTESQIKDVTSKNQQRSGYYFTKTDKQPTYLQDTNSSTIPYDKEYMDDIIQELLVPKAEKLGTNEKAAFYYKLGLSNLEEVIKLCNLTQHQIEQYAKKALLDLKQADQIQETPNDPTNL